MEEAICSGNLPTIQLLSNNLTQEQLNTYFVLSAKCGQLLILEYFIQQGISIQICNRAQQAAVRTGYLHIVKYLHEHGANIFADNNWPLQLAIIYKRDDIIQYLKDHGAQISEKNFKIYLPQI